MSKKYDAATIATMRAAQAAKVKDCGNCGATPTVAKDRCNACYTHLKRKKCERPLPMGYTPPAKQAPAPAQAHGAAPEVATPVTLADAKGRPVDEKGRAIATDPRAASHPLRITRKVLAETFGVERHVEPGHDPFRVAQVKSSTWVVMASPSGLRHPYNMADVAYISMLRNRGGYTELARIEAASYSDAVQVVMAQERAERQPKAIASEPAKRARKAS